jgi:hypothetical protein
MKSGNPSLTTKGEGLLFPKIDIKARKCGKWPWLATKLIHTVNDEY